MKLTLTRDEHQPQPYCTVGVASLDSSDSPKFQTIELPWLPSPAHPFGLIGSSCIAKGTYQLEPRFTEARGQHFIVSNPELGLYRYPADIPAGVYGRSLVLIHAANWAHELLGCIAPGAGRKYTDGELGVTDSRSSLRALVMLTERESDFTLEIH